jgi:acetylornithine/succinyldiaminopimelate/putrescine aminotransferase
VQHLLLDTVEEMTQEQVPNFFRLYLNPYVTRACYCLDKIVRDTWCGYADETGFQTFLANGFLEALSGAVKLARFALDLEGRPRAGLLVDGDHRLRYFASLRLPYEKKIEFIPELHEARLDALDAPILEQMGYLVLFPSTDMIAHRRLASLLARLPDPRPLVITCVGRSALDDCREQAAPAWPEHRPDIVVFDESFVRNHVPFGAFTARRCLYKHWNRRGYTTFHSTTFQPNTISALHFLRCLEKDRPAFYAGVSDVLDRIGTEPSITRSLFKSLYSPSLAKMIASATFDDPNVKAYGHYVTLRNRRIFDGVAGIASSLRGHNPPTYALEVGRLGETRDCQSEVRQRLADLTGLPCLVPAVSGASAVENALRIGLAAQFPRKHVLAFQGGFGGKTLLALTGTAKAAYKEHIDPLYPHVLYLNPFDGRVLAELDAVLQRFPIAMVQLELVQAVGGVRPIPEPVVRFLAERRQQHGYLLFVDEVQTGMYRTGPLVMCQSYGFVPDLLTLGKAASDMMFPFSVTLYAEAIQQKLDQIGCDLPARLRAGADYEFGYRTLLNGLEWAETADLSSRVRDAGALFSKTLASALASCREVVDIRVFGLLIAIELDMRAAFPKWLRKPAPLLQILNLLLHPSFPMLIGYTQYEPNVLKLTPPLTVTNEEIEHICRSLRDVLCTPWYGLVASTCGHVARTYARKRKTHSRRRIPSNESFTS